MFGFGRTPFRCSSVSSCECYKMKDDDLISRLMTEGGSGYAKRRSDDLGSRYEVGAKRLSKYWGKIHLIREVHILT